MQHRKGDGKIIFIQVAKNKFPDGLSLSLPDGPQQLNTYSITVRTFYIMLYIMFERMEIAEYIY